MILNKNVVSGCLGVMAFLGSVGCVSAPNDVGGLTKTDSVLYSFAPSSLLVISADADNDLTTSSDEFVTYVGALFPDIDADNDGKVGPIEYDRWAVGYLGSAELQPAFYTFDKNVNNEITPLEFNKAAAIFFNRLDKDEDNLVTRAELIIERQFQGPIADGAIEFIETAPPGRRR